LKNTNRKVEDNFEVPKLETGIPGFDHVSCGGLPRNRTTLISGSAGSAKTVMACQYLAEGIKKKNESGVFVTFEESPEDIRKNMLSFGWDIAQWEADDKWAFVDASPHFEVETIITSGYDLGALLVRIENAIRKVNARRMAMDSLGAIFNQFTNRSVVRAELLKIATALKKIGITTVMTAERTSEYGEIARFDVEEFVADNVIILRNVLDDEKRRRTLEILKFRGTFHQKGEYPFTIMPNQGIIVIPLSAMQLEQRSSQMRITSGVEQLDRMCGGGFFRDSIILVSGATGTGKTLMVTHFVSDCNNQNERCLLFAYEESRDQLFRNAFGWGMDFEKLEKEGRLKVVCEYPEVMGLEDHLIKIKREIEEFRPTRVAVDSLSALERVATPKGFREFVIGLTSFIKHQEIAGLFTSTTPTLMGGTSITEAHISTVTDSIILLRYVEIYGEMRRGVTVLKMRGSAHEKEIREFSIDETGMHIGRAFRNISGILAGTPQQVSEDELKRVGGLFKE
jgi:circadian clock protein KaiC